MDQSRPSLLSAMQDPQFRNDCLRGLLDAGNRGAVAGLLGMPVDTVASAMKPFGYSHHAPVGGSEWIIQQMLKAGIISPNRNPAAEQWANTAAMIAMMKHDALKGVANAR